MKRFIVISVVLGNLIAIHGIAHADVRCSETADKPLRIAREKLQNYVEGAMGADQTVKLDQLSEPNETIGDEGYVIRSKGKTIVVEANTNAGLANGAYTMLRTLMIEDLASPFDRTWSVSEKPQFSWRSMMVAPYNFGASHGFSVLSPDTWAFKHWKRYLDYLRLFNMNGVGIYAMRPYDPEIPETWPNKTRYEIWKQAMQYCHDLGMKFIFVQTANGVSAELWWKHPELRTGHEIGWTGCTLCYSKARDIIRKTQRHTYEYFKDADYFMFMFSDGGGGCYCEKCSPDQAAVFMQVVNDVQQTLSEIGSDAGIVFWNWLLSGWYEYFTQLIPDYLQTYPGVKDIQKNVFERLPKNIVFEDVGLAPKLFGGYPDTLKEARERGYETTVNFCYFMNLESCQYMFPRPDITNMITSLQHSKKIGISGVDGYRLSPSTRMLSDFAFMRLAWNPDLTREQLYEEMAGYLTTNQDNRKKVAQAVQLLDEYGGWEGPGEKVDKASQLLDEAKVGEPSYQIEYLADIVCLMPGIRRLRVPDLPLEAVNEIKAKMFQQIHRRYILQGFGGTDYQWANESNIYFRAFVDMWAPQQRVARPRAEQQEK